MSSLTKDQLASRYSVVLKPSEFIPMIRLIQHWTNCSGEEWTVRRLKDIRQMALHHFIRLPYEPSERIASTKGVCKGPFKVLFMHGRRAFLRRWNACMVYTGFVSEKITERQWTKFIQGVERPPVNSEALARAKGFIVLGFRTCFHQRWPKPPRPQGEDVLRYPARAGKRKIVGTGTSLPETEAMWPSVNWALKTSSGFLSHFPNVASGTLGRFGFNASRPVVTAVVGTVSCIQEPGYKARIIANPSLVYQQMLRPLYKWLTLINASLPGNFQFSQGEGLKYVLVNLQAGKPAVSIDASGWTDHFPRALSMAAMECLGVDQEWLIAFDKICGAEWKLPRLELASNCLQYYADGTKAVPNSYRLTTRWTVGQPLGLLPTFNAASLAHVLLASGIQTRCLETMHSEPAYAIVGDDIVWFDKECAEVYMQVLGDLGVPLSLDKTLVSDRAAEFCSRLIDRRSIVYAPKWKMASDDSFIEVVRPLGPRGLRLLRKKQRKVVKIIAPLPEPYGLGWNPKGISKWERMQFLESLQGQPQREIRLKSLDHRALELHYLSGGIPELITRNESTESTVDQTAVQSALLEIFGFQVGEHLVKSLLSDLVNWSEVISDELVLSGRLSSELVGRLPGYLRKKVGDSPSRDVSALVHKLCEVLELMEEANTPGHRTTLERLERVLRKLGKL